MIPLPEVGVDKHTCQACLVAVVKLKLYKPQGTRVSETYGP